MPECVYPDWILIFDMILRFAFLFQTGVDDLQTLADRLAQKSICASLLKTFPKITIIGEEVRAFETDLPEALQNRFFLQLCKERVYYPIQMLISKHLSVRNTWNTYTAKWWAVTFKWQMSSFWGTNSSVVSWKRNSFIPVMGKKEQ